MSNKGSNSLFLSSSSAASFGDLVMLPAGQYGGAHGGVYGVVGSPTGTADIWSSTLTFKAPVSYFGFWWSAADPGNQFTLYSGNKAVVSMNDQTLINALGSCSSSNPYCGNPNNGMDKKELFVYVNIYDTSGLGFTSANFRQTEWGGFEFDSLLYLDDPPTSTPEPASWALLGLGILAAATYGKLKRA